MSGKFIDDVFERDIKQSVVDRVFTKLNEREKTMIYNYIYGITQFIASCYDFYEDHFNFVVKLKQNNFKDLRWLITYLIPYVDQTRSTQDITSLNDLYTLRYDELDKDTRDKVIKYGKEDINFTTPKYVFSNIQYGRFNREGVSINFHESHMRDNYLLLLDTIKTTRYKLYINWIDIIPFRIDNYKESKLYKDTSDKITNNKYSYWDPVDIYPIEKVADYDTIVKLNEQVNGLSIDEIYDTISNDLYESVVQYKWLLFDIGIMKDTKPTITCLFYVLEDILEFKNKMGKEWGDLTDDEKDKFKNNWINLIDIFESNKGFSTDEYFITDISLSVLVKSLVVFFDKRYDGKKKDYNYISLGRDNEDYKKRNIDDYDERMKDITKDKVLITIRTIPYNIIFEFLRDTMQGFRYTWYARYILDGDNYKYKPHFGGENMTYKSVYNFCKSFVHKSKNLTTDGWFSEDFTRLPQRWINLLESQKKNIVGRVNSYVKGNTKGILWFNIRRNLRMRLRMLLMTFPNPKTEDKKILEMTHEICGDIFENLATIIFETLIMKGTMTKMIAENDLTNELNYDITRNDEHKKELIKELTKRRFYEGNPYYNNSYYYLTNKTFGNIKEFTLEEDHKYVKYDYFKICSDKKYAWYLATAFHWIAQLGFCHRFIHNRVNYITGATGAGKSTQTPKLYLYYLKALDRNNSPTVLITIPRTSPVISNSDYISKEMAVPINAIVNKKKEETKNYYVQYKHRSGDNVKNKNIPKIRFVTDGSVIQEIKDPLLKAKKIDKRGKTFFEKIEITKYNKYDVIIVDEAHEHNLNMDLILTFIKYPIYYNNQLRLAIMSATMDDDEPIYRRYYRNINDNLKYPLSHWLRKHKIDRVNTDRRFHISPPDQTTRYKIEDVFNNQGDPDDKVIEIIKKTQTGDILYFRPGSGEISESVMKLNKKGVLPDYVIALPYHAKLDKNTQRLIKEYDKNINKIRISKETKIDSGTLEKDIEKGDNSYSRVILVATNIAEASDTYDRVRYVVETGIEKVMVYNPERRGNLLMTKYITDASRLQRRGRVGRTAPGTVYYMYKEGTMANNRKQFGISIQDLHLSVFLNMLRDVNDKEYFPSIINEIVSGKLNGLRMDKINKIIEKAYGYRSVTAKTYVTSIIQLIANQYTLDDATYDYHGNDDMYDYHNDIMPYKLYSSGFDMEQLTDNKGLFYIIHPDELSMKRNINGDVISTDTNNVILDNQKMISNKIIVFWESLLNKMLVGINENGIFYRTKLGSYYQYFTTNFSLPTDTQDMDLLSLMFYGYALSKDDDELEEIINVVSILQVITLTMRNLIDENNLDMSGYKSRDVLEKEKDKIKKFYSDGVYSDIQLLIDIIKKLDKILLNNGIEYNVLKYIDAVSEYNLKDNLKDNLNENTKDEQDKKKQHAVIKYLQDMKDKMKDITILKNMGINYDIYERFVRFREQVRVKLDDCIKNNNVEDDTIVLDIQGVKTLMKDHREFMDKMNIGLLKGAIMLSYPYNIMKKIKTSSTMYMSVYNPRLDTIMNIGDTFVDPMYLSDYILCLTSNYDLGKIGIIIRIKEQDIKFLANVYNKKEIMYKYSDENQISMSKVVKEYIENNLSGEIKSFTKYTVPDKLSGLVGMKETMNDMRTILMRMQDSDFWSVIDKMKLGEKYGEYWDILRK